MFVKNNNNKLNQTRLKMLGVLIFESQFDSQNYVF